MVAKARVQRRFEPGFLVQISTHAQSPVRQSTGRRLTDAARTRLEGGTFTSKCLNLKTRKSELSTSADLIENDLLVELVPLGSLVEQFRRIHEDRIKPCWQRFDLDVGREEIPFSENCLSVGQHEIVEQQSRMRML